MVDTRTNTRETTTSASFASLLTKVLEVSTQLEVGGKDERSARVDNDMGDVLEDCQVVSHFGVHLKVEEELLDVATEGALGDLTRRLDVTKAKAVVMLFVDCVHNLFGSKMGSSKGHLRGNLAQLFHHRALRPEATFRAMLGSHHQGGASPVDEKVPLMMVSIAAGAFRERTTATRHGG